MPTTTNAPPQQGQRLQAGVPDVLSADAFAGSGAEIAAGASSSFRQSASLAARWPLARKTRGLNIEDTRLTCPRKLALLMALVALAIAWAGRAAADLLGSGSPRRKAHGHFAQSWFRTGFDQIRSLLSAGHRDALNAWRRLGKPGHKRTQLEGVV